MKLIIQTKIIMMRKKMKMKMTMKMKMNKIILVNSMILLSNTIMIRINLIIPQNLEGFQQSMKNRILLTRFHKKMVNSFRLHIMIMNISNLNPNAVRENRQMEIITRTEN